MLGSGRRLGGYEYHSIARKLSTGAIRLGHAVSEFSDRGVARGTASFGVRRLGKRQVSLRFLHVIETFRPDVVWLNFADLIDNDTLRTAQRLLPELRIAEINIDPLQDPKGKNANRLAARIGVVDAVFVTTAGPALDRISSARTFAAYMPNPVDASVEDGCAFREGELAYDLIAPFGNDKVREIGEGSQRPSAVLKRLQQLCPGLKVLTPGLNQPALRARAMREALSTARMGWSLSRLATHPLYASDRMVQLSGAGLLTLVDRRTGFGDLYGADALGLYDGEDELAHLIQAFRRDDAHARRVAETGWALTHRLFAAERVAGYVLEQLEDRVPPGRYEWPVRRHAGPGVRA
jgi:hypothetical protein